MVASRLRQFKIILMLAIAPMAAHGATARRTVMEHLATTGSSLFVSSSNVRVGVGTSTPATTLDVNGTSQFGTTVKSTFSTTGDLTLAVNADITLSGASGFITSASSVNASAFFGDGSALTGISAGESNTYTSSKTFTSDVLGNSSITASGFYGDGSALTGLPVAQSTVTYNLTGSTTETTTFKICYASGTITTGGSAPVQVHYSGSVTSAGAAGTYCVLNIMQDGAFVSPYSSTVGMGAAPSASAGGFGNATMVRVLPAPSAGSHSWCLSMIAPFGSACTFTYASAHGNEFGVTELK